MWYKFSLDTLQKALIVKIPSHFLRDTRLEAQASEEMSKVGYKGPKILIFWNSRLRSTAGIADWSKRLIGLNPKLKDIDEAEVQRTLRHELAHFLANSRHRRRRIQAHGEEWKQACADLGIPNESRCHNLAALEENRKKVPKKLKYICPACSTVLLRVRPYKDRVACLKCCKKHNSSGKYDERFRMRGHPIEEPIKYPIAA